VLDKEATELVKELRRNIDQIREKILFETFMNLKQHQVKNLIRSQVDDILRLRERIDPFDLHSTDARPYA